MEDKYLDCDFQSLKSTNKNGLQAEIQLASTLIDYVKAETDYDEKTTNRGLTDEFVDEYLNTLTNNYTTYNRIIYAKKVNEVCNFFEKAILTELCQFMVCNSGKYIKPLTQDKFDYILKSLNEFNTELQKCNVFRINEYLRELLNSTLNDYYKPKANGRPKGTGKRQFIYNGKVYNTVQECADDYGVVKSGMYKKLKKLGII